MKRHTHKLAILFGGQSSEHEATRKSFAYLYERITQVGLRQDLQVTHIIYLTLDGQAIVNTYDAALDALSYERGEMINVVDAFKFIKSEDVFVYGVMYGQNGEDGRIQGLAEFFALRTNFGSTLSCALSMSKYHLNQYVDGSYRDIKVPQTVVVKQGDDIKGALSQLVGKEIVVKPNSLGSSIMTEKFHYDSNTFSEIDGLVSQILEFDVAALVQEYVLGTEYSCACLEKDDSILRLPAVKVETENHFFGQKEKFIAGYSRETIIDENEETQEAATIRNAAYEMFRDLEFQNAARFDFIVAQNGVYFLEANPLPGILRGSILPKMLRTKGWDVEDLVAITFDNAQQRRRQKIEFDFEINV